MNEDIISRQINECSFFFTQIYKGKNQFLSLIRKHLKFKCFLISVQWFTCHLKYITSYSIHNKYSIILCTIVLSPSKLVICFSANGE